MKKMIIGVSLLAVVAVATTLLLTIKSWQSAWEQNSLASAQVFVIEPGTSTNALLRDLAKMELVPDSRYFRKWLSMRGLEHAKVGEYELLAGDTAQDIWEKFSAGEVKRYTVTIVEGMNVYEVLEVLRSRDFLVDDVEAQTPNALAQELGLAYESAEGFFAPETYTVNRGDTVSSVLITANGHLREWLDALDLTDLANLPLDGVYEVLTLASIVEKETAVVSERPLIAGVFVNRLRRGMRLQTDPTVIYGIGPDFNGDITRRDLRTPTPWNTYVIQGLPPTPIAMPSREAIEAVMNPDTTEYLYFVAKGDGSHYFSQTLEEHNRAVRQYQLRR